MQVHFPVVADKTDYPVRLNLPGTPRPFAIIDLKTRSGIELWIDDVDDADRLIRAAAEAKRLLSPPEPPQPPDPDACKCGHLAAQHIYSWPMPCTQCGCKEFDAAVAPDDEPPSVEWALYPGPYCTASHEPLPGMKLICELKPAHNGPHRSIGYQDGDEDITWNGETATAGAA